MGRATVVIVISDGLDVGEPELLRGAMRELSRRSAAVVWLNPLLETPGYEPTARGMRAARPYVTTFGSVNDAEGLARLSRLVRVRA
ncbi:MAG TPA: VWA domain-containing protein [Vicinamibacterales bacterium]|nr:VWA domain-containing protein [Vicinamibacterales bacterium]